MDLSAHVCSNQIVGRDIAKGKQLLHTQVITSCLVVSHLLILDDSGPEFCLQFPPSSSI